MKPNLFSKILGQSKILRLFRTALVAPALMITVNVSQAGTAPATAPAEEPTPAANWITFTIGGASISGDESNFMRRTRTSDFNSRPRCLPALAALWVYDFSPQDGEWNITFENPRAPQLQALAAANARLAKGTR